MRKEPKTSDLRHRVVIEKPVLTADGAGGYIQSWTEVATVWAALDVFSRSNLRELEQDEQLTERQKLRVVIRHRTDVDHDMRMQIDGENWNIRTAVDPTLRGVWLECAIEKGVAL